MICVEAVGSGNISQFVEYCMKYGPEHDESYLPGHDLCIREDHPSYILRRDQEVVGAVSLMRSPNFQQVGKGRFAIYHSKLGTSDAYSMLMDAIRPHFEGLRSVYLFLPETKQQTATIIQDIGFQIERYAYVLVNQKCDPQEIYLPPEYSIVSLSSRDDPRIRDFTDLVNANFAALAGHTHLSTEMVSGWFADECYHPGGICILMNKEEPVGTLVIMKEYSDRNAAEIIAFSISREYRRKGLGRMLLRYAMNFAISTDLEPVYLSVNAENESALDLYISEGYSIIETAVCYTYDGIDRQAEDAL